MPSPLHILWLTENYYPNRGGMAQSCDRIVYHLRQAGVMVDVIHFTSPKRSFTHRPLTQGSYTAFPVSDDPAHTLNLLWNHLNHPDHSQKYTHLLVFGGHLPILAGPMYAAWLDLPLITCLRGNDVDSAIFMPRRRAVLKDALEQSTAICSVSEDKIDRLQRWLPKARFHHTPNGIDLTEWKPSSSELTRAKAWKDKHVQHNRLLIGIFGHLKAKKGLGFLIRAIDRRGLRDRVHLLISGEVEHEAWERPLQETEMAYTHIPFMDRYELLAWYPACDVVAIPSHYEGMPNTLLEAGALGIPILASNIDGMKDVMEEGKYGYLFHPGDLEGCRSALQLLIQASPSERQYMGVQLKEHIEQHYSHNKEIQRYIEIFHQTIPIHKI